MKLEGAAKSAVPFVVTVFTELLMFENIKEHKPTEEKKGAIKNSIGRLIFVAISMSLQLALFYFTTTALREKYVIFGTITRTLAVLVPLRIYGKHMNSSYKISWIIVVMAAPVFGVCLYLLFGNEGNTAIIRKRMGIPWENLRKQLYQSEEVVNEYSEKDRAAYNISYYLQNFCGFPVYKNTKVTYYGDTNDALAAQKVALRAAKKYIFMEYYAIEDSTAWNEIEPILIEKAQEGLDVRLYYDDVGSISFVNKDFKERLQSQGIDCHVFNQIVPFINVIMNNRDHRKITVIDGTTAFTGGYNLADEYFNITHPNGVWKDSGVKVEGQAVMNFLGMFLEMWSSVEKRPLDMDDYIPGEEEMAAVLEKYKDEKGYVQPYADSPMDGEQVGENVYLNLIKYATKYIYITTPYLIIDDEMEKELILAATRGVDVRIVTPGIPDKAVIYQVTRSNYAHLARMGVRIYEYTPGFLHAKQFVVDDVAATVGTVNMDFRSLYLHFEDGCLFAYNDAVLDVKKDFESLFEVSAEVSYKYKGHRNWVVRSIQCVFRLVSPLL